MSCAKAFLFFFNTIYLVSMDFAFVATFRIDSSAIVPWRVFERRISHSKKAQCQTFCIERDVLPLSSDVPGNN